MGQTKIPKGIWNFIFSFLPAIILFINRRDSKYHCLLFLKPRGPCEHLPVACAIKTLATDVFHIPHCDFRRAFPLIGKAVVYWLALTLQSSWHTPPCAKAISGILWALEYWTEPASFFIGTAPPR